MLVRAQLAGICVETFYKHEKFFIERHAAVIYIAFNRHIAL